VVEHWIVDPGVAGSIPVTHPSYLKAFTSERYLRARILENVSSRATFNERSIGLRQRSLACGVLAIAGVALATGCGDDKPAKDQTVFWVSLSTSQGKTCSSARSYSLPDMSARDNIVGSGGGERLKDGGENLVECSVSKGTAPGSFNVSYTVSVGEIGSYSASGVVTAPAQAGQTGTGTLDVSFQTTQFTLGQESCVATVKQAAAGVIWVSNLSCPTLKDENSPAVECVGTGGFIAENCSR
jgi:hypothetical protein